MGTSDGGVARNEAGGQPSLREGGSPASRGTFLGSRDRGRDWFDAGDTYTDQEGHRRSRRGCG